MSNLLEKASIITTPTAYSDGKLHSVKGGENADFDFQRGSAATRVNSQGLIENVQTLSGNLVQNGDFATDSDWTKQTSWSISGGSANYDFLSDSKYIRQTLLNGGFVAGKTYKINFEITSGTAYMNVNSNASGLISINTYSVGSYSIYVTPSTSASDLLFYGRNTNGTAFSIDNISVIEITHDTDLPRIDYTDGCGSLLLEPQSTNLMTYSSDFSLYVLSSINLVSNIILSPDNSLTASKIYPTLSGNYRHIKWNPQSPASGLNTFSIFAKAGELEHLVLIDYDGSGAGVDYNLSTGVATDNSTNPFDSVEMIDYGNGWYRCIATATNAYFYYILSDNGGLSVTANGTDGLYIWGAQVEAQSYATSYIPTSGSTVTRLADVCNSSGSSDLINSTEGVLYVETATLANDGTRQISISSGSNNDKIAIAYNTNGRLDVNVTSGGAYQVIFNYTGVVNPNIQNKIALKYKLNDFALWVNGVEVATDSIGITPVGLNVLNFSSANTSSQRFYGNVKSVVVFKEALTDDGLEKLTTI
jgi:hypothetical protein